MFTVVRSRPRAALAALATVTALALAGCSSSEPDTESAAPASADAFPVTIPSALGDAVIPAAPERVVTWGWSSQDAVLALGVVPVAMPKNTYGGDADGVLPWDAEKIKELGGTTPTLLSSDTGEVPFEEIVEADPDVILAPYSGIVQADYDKLSKIAPVVAYPEKPWALPWQDQLEIIGKALGKTAEAKELLTKTEAHVKDLADKNPILKDKTFLYGAANEADTLNVFRASDPRVALLGDLGMTVSPSVAELDEDPNAGSYFYGTSYENVEKIKTDLLVMYFDDQAAADKFVADPVIAAMPAVKEGRFAPIVGQSFVMASSAPTALSIPWMLDQYVPQLAAVAEKVAE
ncbi:iron-siderophore ABC transporter substrate-binding protein [Actinocorallia sp. A-T 12471]|uniref:iron-siderophore ABC transporter substrate-binding protein n=1 Tax=Actinocorallia sp. A-T 12471 TaxID=3089813 RepID=UPI0029D1F361|nr:iron-siderophore ABC transporter substrate-binding protein [Actinocorallia sp. A-T 12471]MDX6742252.1 iron-siderophore ABC transporter substrate-binding protein [Actinocorallia sp. A-T 12471]